MKEVALETIDRLCREATASPRRRAHLNLHEDLEEDVQRLLIAMQPGTYVRPHRHPEPYKKETLIILQGRCACFTFHNDGSINKSVILDPAKGTYLCEIPDQQWHGVTCLSDNTVVLEFKRGPYTPLTPENFATWAPEENSNTCSQYMAHLIRTVEP
ncbi:MAG: cupin fold metalloprotein, WbuC family [Verrucomicrobiaceae bacterium]|nr:cupin fold metalloprotein, WbuC family [Verrucomicrobiaceae bacterium]